MEIKKPELSELDKKRGNEIWRHLRDNGVCTKEELCKVLGWEYNLSNDRRIREIISNIAKIKPIISTSDNRGYRIAKTKEDLPEVEHTIAEQSKRCEELQLRMQPLYKFRDEYKFNIKEN